MNQACCNCAPKLHVFGSEIHYIRIKVLESFFTIEWCCHYNYYNYDLNKDISFWNSSLSNGLDPAVKRLKLKLQVMTSRGMCFSYCLMRAVMLIKVTVQVTWSIKFLWKRMELKKTNLYVVVDVLCLFLGKYSWWLLVHFAVHLCQVALIARNHSNYPSLEQSAALVLRGCSGTVRRYFLNRKCVYKNLNLKLPVW